MGRRISLLITMFSVALIAALLPAASFADPAKPPPPPISYSATGLNPPPGLANTNGRLAVMLELATATANPSGPGGISGNQPLAAAQGMLKQRLMAFGGYVLFQTSLAYNGIAVSIPANQVNNLRGLPGVARVSVISPKLPAGTTTTVPASSSPVTALAQATGQGVRIGVIDRGVDYTHADFGGPGSAGSYTANNPAVLEPGSFPTAKVNGFDFAGDAYDASGASGSDIPLPDPDPLECNSQDPHAGQGSSVAGLAAGSGVAADGTAYHGPYGPGIDLSTLRVAPGVAPEAQLYALKVFGCRGSTALLTLAIERAIDPNGDGDPADHLDVLVIALGTPFGSDDDPDAIAVNNAVRAGIVVAVAVGDNIQTFYSINSPASARLAIAVGATNEAGAVAAFTARGPQRGNAALKPDIVAPGSNMRSAAVATGSEGASLTGTAAAVAQVGGAAALLRQLHADWSPIQIKAALINTATPIAVPPSLAGAGQLSLAGLASVSLLAYGSDGGGLNYGAPWVASAWTATRTLQLENTGDTNRTITLSTTTSAAETGVTVHMPTAPIMVPAHGVTQAVIELAIDPQGLDFTPDAATQPQQGGLARHYLAEHGGSIEINAVSGASGTRVRPAHAAHFQSVDFYLDNQLLDDSLDSREVDEYVNTTPGPHTVKLRKPGASPTSTPIFSAPVELLDGRDYTLIVVGRPGELGIVVVDETAPAPPAAGQGLIHFVNANRVGLNWNIGPLDVYLDGVLQIRGLAVGATSSYFPLAPGTHTVRFFHTGVDPVSGRDVAHKTFVSAAGEAILAGTGRHDDDDSDLSDDEQRAFIGRGDVRLGLTLIERVPFHIFPTVAADAHAAGRLSLAPGTRAFSMGLQNTGARNTGLNGALGTPRTPLASAFELEATSPQIAALSQGVRGADVQFVGVTSSYSVTQNLSGNTAVYFGLSSYGPWSTPNEVEFLVYIDSNKDGRDDFVLVNTNWGTATGGPASDVFISGLYPLRPDGTPDLALTYSLWGSFPAPIESSINMAPYNTAVMFQSVALPNLAPPLDPNNLAGPKGPVPTSFCYHVETRARDLGNFGMIVDRVPDIGSPAIAACGNRSGVLRYDIQNFVMAPINTTNFVFGAPTSARPIFVDINGGQITGAVNPVMLAAHPDQKLLILHHHNAPVPQAEVVGINGPLPAPLGAAGKPWVHVPIATR